jgi:hypothetical protein
VDAYQVSPAVTAQNIDAFTSDLESVIRQSGLTVQGTPQKVTMAGLPGVRLRFTGTTHGTRYASTAVFAFNGTTEYEVNCQYTPGMAAQVARACDQVTGSFQVSRAASGAAAQASNPPSPGSSPVNSAPGSGGLGAKVVPAPAGFVLSQDFQVHNGPMTAADFNRYLGGGDLAASLHFVRGYDVTYVSISNDDSIEVTLFQFATPADAAAFKAEFASGGGVTYKADPVITGGADYDSTTADQGVYLHGVMAAKGNLAFQIDTATGSAAPVPVVRQLARQQYAAL